MLLCYLALAGDAPKRRLFEVLYRQYRRQMLYVADSVLHNQADAEDAVHNAFTGIAKNMETIQNIQNEADRRNYLLKAAKNAALSMLPQKQRQDRELPLDSLPNLSDGEFLERLCEKAAYEAVVSAMLAMDARYRDALYYHFVLGFSAAQTAKALGRTTAAVKQQLVRGKKLLLETLKEMEPL